MTLRALATRVIRLRRRQVAKVRGRGFSRFLVGGVSLLALLAAILLASASQATASPAGIDWTSRTSPNNHEWNSVAFGNGVFVAVASSGTGNRVMTSSDGVTWTSRASAADNNWWSVTYGNGLLVAVSSTGTGNRVMTSPDGITWTSRTSAADNDWYAVTYGNGLFVAVSTTGSGNRVMTSPNGITWTSRISAANNLWRSVTYGNGLFVAVSYSGIGNRVMTSPDGITWTSRTSAANNNWFSVTYGNGLFIAVSSTGTGNRVMTSPDGITWTSRTSAANNAWRSVTFAAGLFIAVSSDGSGNRVMTSPDGITWAPGSSAADNSWYGVAYGSGLFAAVANTGTGNRVMTSSAPNVVTYDGNGNTGGTAPVDPSSPYNLGATVTVAANSGGLVRTGYAFSGWNTAADGSGSSYAPASTFSMPNNAVTLYAQWTAFPNHIVSFNANGGSGTMADQVANVPTALSANTFSRVGYSFSGWNTAANGGGSSYADAASYPFSSDTTLYAQWTVLPLPPQVNRAGYCLAGKFLDLVTGQPDTDPLYKGAVLSIFVKGKGITCDPPPPGYTRQGHTADSDNVGAGTYPLYAPAT